MTTPDPSKLTDRQRQILEYLSSFKAERGFPPTMREICEHVGLKSTSSVSNQLKNLEKAGYLTREHNRPRAVDVTPNSPSTSPDEQNTPGAPAIPDHIRQIPLVGQIAAGNPLLAQQSTELEMDLPVDLVGHGELFMLRVVGESMIDAAIADGDFVVVRQQVVANNGDIVAAMIDGEATVKTFKSDDSGVWLIPHNDLFEPIKADKAAILGKVVTVLRKL